MLRTPALPSFLNAKKPILIFMNLVAFDQERVQHLGDRPSKARENARRFFF